MACASIAGLPVQAGLYVALVPMFVYALLGTSRPLSVSTTSTIAILTAAELELAVPGGDSAHLMAAASTLALLVGAFLFVAGLLRLGFLANFISDPILTGFKAGVGVVIIVGQVPKLLGVHIESSGFFRDVISILEHVPDSSAVTLICPRPLWRFFSGWSVGARIRQLPSWPWSWVSRPRDSSG